MKGLAFRSSLPEKPSSPSEDSLDIRMYLRRPPSNQSENHIYITEESIPKQIKKIINEIQSNESISVLDVLILLRKGKEMAKYNKDRLNNGILCCYLGIMYYKTGLLEEAFQEFLIADTAIKEHMEAKKLSIQAHLSETDESYSVIIPESKWLKIRARIHLQLCILLSEIDRHQLAQKHAQLGIKFFYEVAVNYLLITRGILLSRTTNSSRLRPYTQPITSRNINLIGILNKLIEITGDLKLEYLSKQKILQLQSQNNLFFSHRFKQPEPNIQEFITETMGKCKWILANKILNQVQMQIFNKSQYLDSSEVTSNDVLEIIVYLSVGFYCLSTQSRFVEKQTDLFSFGSILESESWLSRALEVAYTFLPIQAPILGQIYSVHDKYYGLGKQPIPEDGEMEGNIKFLRQVRKASSVYDKKTMLLCAPVLVRVNPMTQFSPQKAPYEKSKHIKMRSLTIDLNQQKGRSQLKRNSLQKTYRKNGRRFTRTKGSSSLEREDDDILRMSSNEQKLRSISTDFGVTKLSNLVNPKIDIQINNNINVYFSNPQKSFDDKAISSEFREKHKDPPFFQNRKMILKLIPGSSNPKDSTSKRNVYHQKRKSMTAKDIELSEL